MNQRVMTRICLTVGFFLFWAACSTPPSASDAPHPILEPEAAKVGSEKPESATLRQLQEKLAELGYEAVGMQHEAETEHAFLLKIFSDPTTKNRKIRLLYTGLELSYDSEHESLTVGGTQDVGEVLRYIRENVPEAPPAPEPTPNEPADSSVNETVQPSEK